MRSARWGAALLAAAAVAGTAAGQAQAADLGVAYATLAVSCPANGSGSGVSEPPVGATHPTTVARVRSVNGQGRVEIGQDGSGNRKSVSARAGEVRVTDTWQMPAGALPYAQMSSCGPAGGSAVVELYDRPDVPASYGDLQAAPMQPWESDNLDFGVPSAVRLVADVTVSQGSVQVCGENVSCQTFASPGLMALGAEDDGEAVVQVRANDGPAARYSVRVRPLAVALGTVKFDREFVAPGSPASLEYQPDGQTSVTATVLAPSGAPVRELASALAVQPGSRSLTWDARDSAGGPVADGVYTALVRSQDPYGGQSEAQAKITVDGTGPLIAPGLPLRPADAVSVTLSDALGVAAHASTAQVTSPAGPDRVSETAFFSGSGPQIVAVIKAPSGGWQPGVAYTLKVSSEDRAGNRSGVARTFTVPAPKVPVAKTGPKGTAAGTLSKARTTRALRAALSKRLRAVRLSRVSCRRSSALRMRCTFRGRAGSRKLSGSGAVFQQRAGARVRTDLKVKISGRKTRRWKT